MEPEWKAAYAAGETPSHAKQAKERVWGQAAEEAAEEGEEVETSRTRGEKNITLGVFLFTSFFLGVPPNHVALLGKRDI